MKHKIVHFFQLQRVGSLLKLIKQISNNLENTTQGTIDKVMYFRHANLFKSFSKKFGHFAGNKEQYLQWIPYQIQDIAKIAQFSIFIWDISSTHTR